MTGLILIAYYTDGTTRVVRSEPDTRHGRHVMDKAAFLILTADDVTRVEVSHAAEAARPTRRTYR